LLIPPVFYSWAVSPNFGSFNFFTGKWLVETWR
jgi:hypothetical protein